MLESDASTTTQHIHQFMRDFDDVHVIDRRDKPTPSDISEPKCSNYDI